MLLLSKIQIEWENVWFKKGFVFLRAMVDGVDWLGAISDEGIYDGI